MQRKLIVEITLPEGSVGKYWNADQLLRFFSQQVEENDGDTISLKLIFDSNIGVQIEEVK